MYRNSISSIISAVIAGLLLASCADDAPVEAQVESSRPVKLITISDSGVENTARYPAVISAGTTAELSFLVGGAIQELPVSDSHTVEVGDLIAKLDPRDFESNAASARASFSNAEEEYQRAVRLSEQDAIAKNVLEQRKSQRDVARAQLDSAEKALEDSVLRAPFTGVVASVPVREQQTVSAGTTVAIVIDVISLDATINIPASVIARVPSQEDRGAAVILEAAPDREIEATFSEANLVADATSQTYGVTFSFKAPENMLVLPGMNATIVLRTASNSGQSASISVPLAAVQSDGAGQYVWLVDSEEMTVSRQEVQIAPGIGETVVVTTGLSSGDQVVGAGAAYLTEGARITPWTES